MINGYKYIQAFSIDVSLGGVVGTLFVAKYLDVTPDIFLLVELGLAIWLIYTFDHLIDAGSNKYKLVSFRHKIHRKFSTYIWGIWSFTLIVAFSLLFKIPSDIIASGGILAFIVALYFISLKILDNGKVFHKEILASIIYSSGIFIGPVSLFEGKMGSDFWILFVQFVILALINLLVFSLYELQIDQESGFQSFVKSTGYQRSKRIVAFLILLLVFSASISMVIFHESHQIFKAQLMILMMAVVLMLVMINKRRLIINERFRIVGDAVFFIPLFYVWA